MKTSKALLVAWFVVIAGLIAAIVYFTIRSQSPPEPVPDSTVKPVEPTKRPTGPTRHTDRSGKQAPPPVPKQLVIEGVVRGPDAKPVAGAHVAIFPPSRGGSRPAQGADAPNMDEIRLVNAAVYVSPEEWDLPRPLSSWTASAPETEGDREPTGAEIAGADTNDDGAFSIQIPPGTGAGPYRLTAVKAGVGSGAMPEVRAGQRVELSLGAAALVSGTVITDVASMPVAGARVVFDNGARRFVATTGADGKFQVEGLVPGYYMLSAAAAGMTPLFENRFKINANDPAPLTLRIPRGTLLRVKAVVEIPDSSTDGPRARQLATEPVPNAQVVVFSDETYAYVIATTNHEGVAEFPAMPGGKYTLNGIAKSFVSMGEEQIVVNRNEVVQEETVSFEPAVDTTLEVVDDDGRAVAGVEFFCGNADEKYDALRSARIGLTDTDGKIKFAFEFDGPRCAIYGFKPGYCVVRASPDQYDSGDPIRLVAKKPVHVHGSVKTEDGRGIADAVVTISVSSSDPNVFDDIELEIRTNKDGYYDFPYLPRSDTITVAAVAPDGIAEDDQDLELVEGQSDYTLDLKIDVEGDAAPVPHPPRAVKPPPK